jgi:hypothetical protein
MRTPFHLALLIIGVVFGTIFGAIPLLDRRHSYARWAQIASPIVSVAALTWGTFGIILYHSHVSLSAHSFAVLRDIKAFCAGISLGIIVAVLLARPRQKISTNYKQCQKT